MCTAHSCAFRKLLQCPYAGIRRLLQKFICMRKCERKDRLRIWPSTRMWDQGIRVLTDYINYLLSLLFACSLLPVRWILYRCHIHTYPIHTPLVIMKGKWCRLELREATLCFFSLSLNGYHLKNRRTACLTEFPNSCSFSTLPPKFWPKIWYKKGLLDVS